MRRLGVSPKPENLDTPASSAWMQTITERLNLYSGVSNPTVDEVPENQWVVHYNTSTTKASVWLNVAGSLKQIQTIDNIYPVGSIYLSINSANPSTVFGGTWTAFGQGKLPVGFLSGDPDFGTVEATGGAKTKPISAHSGTAVADHASHTHTTTATGTVSQPTFTGNAVAAASTQATPDLLAGDTTGTGVSPVTTATGTVSQPTFTGDSVTSSGPSATLSHSVTQPSNHSDLNVLPPFIVVYMWKRTA